MLVSSLSSTVVEPARSKEMCTSLKRETPGGNSNPSINFCKLSPSSTVRRKAQPYDLRIAFSSSLLITVMLERTVVKEPVAGSHLLRSSETHSVLKKLWFALWMYNWDLKGAAEA